MQQNQTNREYLFVMLAVTSVGTLVDTITSGLGLLALLKANNVFATVVALGAGVIITGLVVATEPIWKSRNTPVIMKFLWFIAFAVDAYTTLITTINFLILNNNSDTFIYLNEVTFDPNNAGPTALAFGAVMLINGSSVAVAPIFRQIQTP